MRAIVRVEKPRKYNKIDSMASIVAKARRMKRRLEIISIVMADQCHSGEHLMTKELLAFAKEESTIMDWMDEMTARYPRYASEFSYNLY